MDIQERITTGFADPNAVSENLLRITTGFADPNAVSENLL
jgi:hypothetical protein